MMFTDSFIYAATVALALLTGTQAAPTSLVSPFCLTQDQALTILLQSFGTPRELQLQF